MTIFKYPEPFKGAKYSSHPEALAKSAVRDCNGKWWVSHETLNELRRRYYDLIAGGEGWIVLSPYHPMLWAKGRWDGELGGNTGEYILEEAIKPHLIGVAHARACLDLDKVEESSFKSLE